MTPEVLETQIASLRAALAWLRQHQVVEAVVHLGKTPQPVIQIRPGMACAVLQHNPKYRAETTGRARRAGVEQLCWCAVLYRCRVEWVEPQQRTIRSAT